MKHISRRNFIAGVGTSAALAGYTASNLPTVGAAKKDLPKSSISEVAASLYPWDVHDEGIENILDNLQEMAAVNSVYLIALMHKAPQRPLFQDKFPHNPVRDKYHPEDSRIYWYPDLKKYRRIKPLMSDRDWLRDTDWLDVVIEATRKRGLKTGAELSHTYLDSERAEKEFPDCIQQDIFGARMDKRICFSSPDVKDYAAGLFSDLVANHDVDFVQTCLTPFKGAGYGYSGASRLLALTARGSCFCDNCKKLAPKGGFDLERIQAALLPLAKAFKEQAKKPGSGLTLLDNSVTSETVILLRHPELYQWLDFLRYSVTEFYRNIHVRIHKIRPSIEFRLNIDGQDRDNPELRGVDFKALKPHIDSIRICDYGERSGKLESLERDRQQLNAIRYSIGKDKPLISGIDVRPNATPETVRQGVLVAAECGANGISLGHYDGATFERLRAVREGLKLAGASNL